MSAVWREFVFIGFARTVCVESVQHRKMAGVSLDSICFHRQQASTMLRPWCEEVDNGILSSPRYTSNLLTKM